MKRCIVTIKVPTQQILFSGLGGRKDLSSMGKISTLGVLRLRATSAVSGEKFVRRFAQDDGFVGGLKYNWLDMQKTRKDRKSHRLSG
jgi:hypothetical protein